MKKLILSVLLATSAVPVAALPAMAAPAAQPWADRSLDAAARADLLVKAMTFDEKIQMVHGYFPPLAKPAKKMGMIPSAGHIPGIPRLGIPTLRESDASLGVANQIEQRKGDTATALPAGLATAATFSPELARAGGVMIGAEARAKTFNILLAGGVNLTRDPWNGRNFEYLGEDPLLAGVLGGEAIAGVESNHIVSTVKHYVLNSQETGRHVLDARIGEQALRESDLLAFQIAIERGRPGSVMCAYNKINGHYACEQDALLNGVLKGDWKYPGWVMSDWGAVHSTEKAALSGLDQQSGQELDKAIYFDKPLRAAIKAGRVPQARLDDMVRRILTGVIASGLMDDPVPATPQPIPLDDHADVAQAVAEKGIVLLKNEGELLPLARTARKVVLIGAHADVGVLSGGGSSQVRSTGGAPVEIPLTEGEAASFARVTWHASSPLKAIKAALPGADVRYVDGKDPAAAAAAARDADLAIVFAWQWQTEAQDTETIALPDDQDALIDAVAAANGKTLVVLETGGPVLMPWIGKVPAVLQAWYPGQRGGEAIANILTGAVNPSGRLPITFPASASQAPRPEPVGLAQLKAMQAAKAAGATSNHGVSVGVESFPVDYQEGADVGYRWYEKTGQKPLFPFGHGLSYTRFTYGKPEATGGAAPTVSIDVTNSGARAGDDVVQVYVQGGADAPTWRLAGFARVSIDPGRTQRVTIPLECRTFARFDTAQRGWVVDGGPRRFAIGRTAIDHVAEGTITLAADRMQP
ncbi:beta-glucosidase family protein [Sphingomonas fennica]|uniref:Glycosyl hydrolase n=1 Tax=Edaphosphingomonas fennica TaxID=114404 RepID=A0A2T4HYC6_9SPHN|nr:glycoside hydrolase family 3 protein [Sphingomonas fennica]PTD21108.1 glycosyl hydrolase [Sphingomonas fennica]